MSSAAPARRPSPQARLPVDQRLVAPSERYEILDGKVIAVPPSLEPHGNRHSKLQALLEAHVGEAYDVACDMLTRTSAVADFAPDASVYPLERDTESGGRQLEELAFEVLGRQPRSVAGRKADRLLERGVRRVFALDVGRRQVLERRGGQWVALAPDAALEDRALAAPLPIAALVEAAKSDNAVATALLAKNNPVLEARLAQRGAEGKAEGLREGEAKGVVVALQALCVAIEVLCEAHEVTLTEERRQHLASLPVAGLEALVQALRTTRAWPPSRP